MRETQDVQPPSLRAIALCFAELGMRGFGGLASQVHEVLVVRRKWLDEADFAETLGLGQILPGGNVMNMAAMLGDRWRGWPGAVVALLALTVPSTFIAIAIFVAASTAASSPILTSVEQMVVVAASGALVATGLRALRAAHDPQRRALSARRIGTALLVVVLFAIPHAGLPVAFAVGLPLAILVEARAR